MENHFGTLSRTPQRCVHEDTRSQIQLEGHFIFNPIESSFKTLSLAEKGSLEACYGNIVFS